MRISTARGRARVGSRKIARNGKDADMGCNVSKDVKVEDQGNAENKDDASPEYSRPTVIHRETGIEEEKSRILGQLANVLNNAMRKRQAEMRSSDSEASNEGNDNIYSPKLYSKYAIQQSNAGIIAFVALNLSLNQLNN
ncbi:hypothetical protein NPIL_38631 [Nephila pilipes]|uniref:Uncharacterized protein n=1 Tax=Nephila pilipes TaxID=299642 RepID=A0A8X6IUD7_NEPPI|nr:hypothetical protein NPIL_38631 [Nephila pilipes]